MTNNLGYVIVGYVDGNHTHREVYGNADNIPFATIEAAQADIDEDGGPIEDATVFIAALVPVGLAAHDNNTDAQIREKLDKAEAVFGYFDGAGTLTHTAANGTVHKIYEPMDEELL